MSFRAPLAAEILREAAKQAALKPETIKGGSRMAVAVRVRHRALAACVALRPDMRLGQIARVFGFGSHAAVLHGARRGQQRAQACAAEKGQLDALLAAFPAADAACGASAGMTERLAEAEDALLHAAHLVRQAREAILLITRVHTMKPGTT